MPASKETLAQVRAAHMLVRSPEAWNTLSAELVSAWEFNDDETLEMIREQFLAPWRSVAHNLLADTLNGIGISVTAATTDWGIATLSTSKDSFQPQLTSTNTTTGTQPRLRNFEEVISGYNACLQYLVGTNNQPSPAHTDL